MRHVQPEVFLIGRTTAGPDTARWLDRIGVSGFPLEDSTPGEKLVQLCGKRCYMSFKVGLNPNVQRVRDDMSEFIGNLLKVGHGSVLEHASYSFAIEGVSRVFTGEMNRHRAGLARDEEESYEVDMAVSEGSMRFIRYEDIPYWIPASIQHDPSSEHDLQQKCAHSRAVFADVFEYIEKKYAELEGVWEDELAADSKFTGKKAITSMMRRIVPMGVATGGVWTGNLRALRHIFTMRCDASAEEEILLVACLMLERMREVEPLFFGDFERGSDGYWAPRYRKV